MKKIMIIGILLTLFLMGSVSASSDINETLNQDLQIIENGENLESVSYDFDVKPNNPEEMEYGSDLLLDVILPSDAAGSVSYTVNAKKFNITSEKLYSDEENYGEPSIRISADDLNLGLNSLSFTYIGDDYPEKTINRFYTLESYIKIENPYVGWGDDGHVTLKLPSDANGNLNVYELIFYDLPDDIWGYGARFNQIACAPLTNGSVSVAIPNLSPKRHFIYANYTGRDYNPNFIFSYSNLTFEKAIYSKDYDAFIEIIPKIDLPAKIYTSRNYTIDFKLPEYYNGILTVTVGNEERNFTVYDGVSSFKLFSIESATHIEGENLDYLSVKIIYNDNRYDYKFDSSYIIFVSNGQSVNEFDVVDYSKKVLKGEINDVSLVFPDESSGKLEILLDDIKIDEMSIYGSTEYGLPTQNLNLGRHTLMFKYRDENNILKSKSVEFEVTYIEMDYPDVIEIGSSANPNTITLKLLDDATGSVKIIIDGKLKASGMIEDGGYSYDIEDIGVGSHSFEVSYSGNYPAYTARFSLNAAYPQNIQLNDIVYGQNSNVSFELPAGVTGTATLTIASKKFTAKINDDGEAVFDVYGLNQGTYTWTLDYPGREAFPGYKNTGSISVVYKITTNIDQKDSIYVDENITFTLILPKNAKGDLIVSRYSESEGNFKVLDITQVVNGNAEFVFFNLNVGENQFKVRYSGSDYGVIEFNESVHVINRMILPENMGIIVGNPIEYEIQLESAVNTTLRVYMQNNGKYELIQQLNLINGHAYVSLENLSVGLYSIKFESGSGWSHIVCLAVDRDVSWKIIPKVKLGHGNVFEAKLPGNTSGTFTLSLSHPEYSYSDGKVRTLTFAYENGNVAVSSSKLFVGEFKVLNFTFNDSTYGINDFILPDGDLAKFVIENIASVKVSKINSTLTVEFAKDAEGEIIVKLGEKQYIRALDMGRTTISNIDSNSDSIILTYLGSKLYSPISGETIAIRDLTGYDSSEINQTHENPQNSNSPAKVDPKIIAKDGSVLYSAKTKYSVVVYGSNGKVASGVNVIFKVAGKIVARVKTNSRGIASYTVVNNPGKYKISVTSLGKTVNKKLTVRHILSLKSIKVKKSSRQLVLTASLAKVNGKYIAGKNIIFKFNGRKYIAKTNRYGIAKLVIKGAVVKNLKVGRNVVYQASYYKDILKKSAKVIK